MVLTPTLTGVKITPKPLVLPPLKVWDPEGDEVTIEGYGLPPAYAANLSAFLGSLVALYTPGGLTDEDLCAAAVRGEAFVGEFLRTLREA